MAKSTKPKKPSKPYPDFPLFPHATRRWAKKIRNRTHYFGPWDDWEAAIAKYQEQREDLHAGRTPRVASDGLTVKEMCNKFMTAKQRQHDANDLTRKLFVDYLNSCQNLITSFGGDRLVTDLAADDFSRLRASYSKRLNPNSLSTAVQRIKTTFKWALESGLIDRPVLFGPDFKKPSQRILRAVAQAKGLQLFSAEEIKQLIALVNHTTETLIWLGINCGFGASDCAGLQIHDIDLEGGWVSFPRPKTGVNRRCKLWPETTDALRELIGKRTSGAVFSKSEANSSNVARRMRNLLNQMGIHGVGRGFYDLRRSFRTVADGCQDQPAIDVVMGHSDGSMASVYRQTISDERLAQVAS
jgi:integrase